jgi:5-methylcytosine-specific restriction endonuclease McrA
MSQKKPSWNEDATLRGAWRRVFARSPIVRQLMEEGTRKVPRICKDGTRGKVDSKEILCQVCNQWIKASVGGKSNCQIDHVIPVIAIDNIGGKVHDWDEFKARLFCGPENLQRICTSCHLVKTKNEKMIRQSHRDKVLLDGIEERLKSVWTLPEEKDLKKKISKFLSKTKADSTRERALKLKQIIISKLKED